MELSDLNMISNSRPLDLTGCGSSCPQKVKLFLVEPCPPATPVAEPIPPSSFSEEATPCMCR